MNFDEFEQKLRSQSRHRIPAKWRQEILGFSGSTEPTVSLPWWRQWLWPHPAAWTALAALWVIIFALGFAARPEPLIRSASSASHPPDILQAFAERTRLMAELSGESAELRPSAADRPRSARAMAEAAV